jgi:hypothetical protein
MQIPPLRCGMTAEGQMQGFPFGSMRSLRVRMKIPMQIPPLRCGMTTNGLCLVSFGNDFGGKLRQLRVRLGSL